MSKSSTERSLQHQLELLERAESWLRRSLKQCAEFDSTGGLSETEYDALEALASRYSRVVDLLINKVFRAIDLLEFLEAGSLIDTVNRAEGRGLVTVADARLLKELRNVIVHEYEVENFADLLGQIQQNCEVLLRAVALTRDYIGRLS